MTSEEAVFSIVVHCRNCGDQWAEEMGRNIEVQDDWQGVYVHTSPCWQRPCDGKRLECKTCGLTEHLYVGSRRPK